MLHTYQLRSIRNKIIWMVAQTAKFIQLTMKTLSKCKKKKRLTSNNMYVVFMKKVEKHTHTHTNFKRFEWAKVQCCLAGNWQNKNAYSVLNTVTRWNFKLCNFFLKSFYEVEVGLGNSKICIIIMWIFF
jgi:hypothetical protein